MAIVATLASITTAAMLLGYQGTQRKQRVRQLKDASASLRKQAQSQITNKNVAPTNAVADQKQQPLSPAQDDTSLPFDEELIQEQLARNIAFLGEDGVTNLRKSFVIVVGAGGIGSWAASMLIKSGVGKVRIIDFDQLELETLNQHATATRQDLGLPKAVAMKNYFRKIAPWAQVEARVERLQEDSAEALISGKPDYVVDAIGDLSTKVALLKYCHENKIPVMSSMSAGAKADPSRVQISDISETFEDPLARAVRRRLRKAGVDTGIDVVYSTEKPYRAKDHGATSSSSTRRDEDEDDEDIYTPLPNFKHGAEFLPVLVPLPAMFGMSMATYITCKLGGWSQEPLPVKYRDALYQRLHTALRAQEAVQYGTAGSSSTTPSSSTTADEDDGDFPLDRRDIGYLIEEMFKSRSPVSKSMDRIVVCRWKNSEPLSLLNAVVLTQLEMVRHATLPVGTDLETVYGKEVVDEVDAVFKEEQQISRLR
ncbi:hypothetical protein BGZ83_002720 [Gryganskiella cystojenkinii]|nr:hypothetical protein BGZ83_002720 [Gryganskiella cystojenkinii]